MMMVSIMVELEPALVQSVRCYRGQTPLEDVSSLSGVAHRIPDTEMDFHYMYCM